VIVGETRFGEFRVVRLDPDGSPDLGFDSDGKKLLPSGGTAYQSDVRSVLVQSDVGIVLAGQA
jgi:hypothetical protein